MLFSAAYPFPTWLPGGAPSGTAKHTQRSVLPNPLRTSRGRFASFRRPRRDRDRPVSRRSRTQLAYRFHWRTAKPLQDLLQPQDAMSRHPRGAKPPRQARGTLGGDSACYPRIFFYLLSDSLSIQHRRDHSRQGTFVPARLIGLAVRHSFLRLGSRCPIADRAEGTVALLRYRLGGDRPSQTAR